MTSIFVTVFNSSNFNFTLFYFTKVVIKVSLLPSKKYTLQSTFSAPSRDISSLSFFFLSPLFLSLTSLHFPFIHFSFLLILCIIIQSLFLILLDSFINLLSRYILYNQSSLYFFFLIWVFFPSKNTSFSSDYTSNIKKNCGKVKSLIDFSTGFLFFWGI